MSNRGTGDCHSGGVAAPDPVRWGLVVPVKLLALAKTRLGAYGPASREQLALAFAKDVVAAALVCEVVAHVLVVTDDEVAGPALAQPRVQVVADLPGAGLNPALAHGAELLRAEDPGLGVAALSSDLPALRAADLADALRQVRVRAFVADAAGLGTTLLAAAPGSVLAPAYGPRSRAEHLASGAVELPGTEALRRDVDTPADLEQAVWLGVGPSTAAALAGPG